MNNEELSSCIKTAIIDKIKVTTEDDRFLVQLPFLNYKGETIEIGVTAKDNGDILVDDVGFIAGLLFELNEYTEEAPGHLLTKRLTNSYELIMNYNEGVISGQVSVAESVEKLLDFIKVVTSIETVLPFVSKARKRMGGRKRLSARLSREISQLRLPLRVEKQARVEGKHEIWDVTYKYFRREDSSDILLLATDLGLKDPREKAAHIITLASDVLDPALRRRFRRELRVVYSLNGNSSEATRRASSIIEDYQNRIGYKAFNYSDSKAKSEFKGLTVQDLSPMKF